MIEVAVNNQTLRWWQSKGYVIPTTPRLLYATRDGRRVRNGVKLTVARGTRIQVRIEDLPPKSNAEVTYTCVECRDEFVTQYRAHRDAAVRRCKSCAARQGFKGGCHSYWVERLISNNPDARCDISGERDKRFLILHHLLSRSLGGKDAKENYVVLSANLHMAFHNWMGGSSVPCRPEDYASFRCRELAGLRPASRQTDMLAEDWMVLPADAA